MESRLKIAVLSGKGGTGKTLVSVNLAYTAKKALYLDCDVEEPNGHLFFKPDNLTKEDVSVKIPYVNDYLCNGCRKCIEFCKFNALAYINNKVKVFSEVCHSCGGCIEVCPESAISEINKSIGKIEKGNLEDVTVVSGILNTGEASGVPIIKAMIDDENINEQVTIVDCPPGSACIVMESIKDADYCILVAEPTIFGRHNLKMVYDLVKLFDKPHGVVLNKCLEGHNPSEQFCKDNGIKILGKIPFDSEIGMINSNAEILVRKDIRYREMFSDLLKAVKEAVQNETTVNP